MSSAQPSRKLKKDLVSIDELSHDDIKQIFEITKEMKKILGRDIRKVPTLRGRTLVNAFFEPSTRTRISFEVAGKTLSADVINFSSSSSSINKGESIFDTVKTLEKLGADFIAIRSPTEFLPHFVAKHTSASVINAGDGKNEHPTQALLDLFTICEKLNISPEKLGQISITIVGDVLHSRVAHSDIKLFSKLGAKVKICAPFTLIPQRWTEKFEIFPTLTKEVFEKSDVLIFLRIQSERHEGKFISDEREYRTFWGADERKINEISEDKKPLLMHPGPVRWGVELTPSVIYSEISAIPEQVLNGVAVRMAVLYFLFSSR